jgi:hypothetical protein
MPHSEGTADGSIASDPEHESFTSGVLPRFHRRTPSVSAATVARPKDVVSRESETRHCRRRVGFLESSAAGIPKQAHSLNQRHRERVLPGAPADL